MNQPSEAVFGKAPHVPIRKLWYQDNPYITSFLNGLSVSIPEIERFIAKAVRETHPHVRNKHLEKAVETLIHEEEAHMRVHDAYNNLLRRQGYKISKHEAADHAVALFLNKRSIKTRLVVCLCSEFFTAVMSRHVVNQKIYETQNADKRMLAVWTWHSYEELHHRGTAFDLYLDQGGGYFRRCGLMVVLTIMWIIMHVSASLNLVAQSKPRMNFKSFWEGCMFVLGPQGFYINILPSLLLFFKPGFHPKKDIDIEVGLDPELHHFHVEKHFVEVVEAS